MPASDVLNATPTDELNPDYGWQRQVPATQVVIKPAVGPSYGREITDVGHQFNLSYGASINSQKDFSVIARLNRYYEQYRVGGFFTLIDHEGNGRHYVGRFTAPVTVVPAGHNRWASASVTFEEVPGSPMLTYPNDWDNEAIFFYTLDDDGNLVPAVDTFDNWTLGVDADGALSPSSQDLQSSTTDAYVRLSYVGWGFRVYAPTGPDRGIAEVFLDGVSQGTVDQYTAAPTASASLLEVTDVPLGIHVVKVVCTGGSNGSSSGDTIAFDALQVMR